MADTTTPVIDFTSDPLFPVFTKLGEIETKISDSIFENYKLQVAQTNDINNRAMQTAFHTDAAVAALKEVLNNSNTVNLVGFERLTATALAAAAHSDEVTMIDGQTTRVKIEEVNRANLNRQLSDMTTEAIALREGFRGVDRDWTHLDGALQSQTIATQLANVASQIQGIGQGVVNTGAMTGTVQTSTPTNIG